MLEAPRSRSTVYGGRCERCGAYMVPSEYARADKADRASGNYFCVSDTCLLEFTLRDFYSKVKELKS